MQNNSKRIHCLQTKVHLEGLRIVLKYLRYIWHPLLGRYPDACTFRAMNMAISVISLTKRRKTPNRQDKKARLKSEHHKLWTPHTCTWEVVRRWSPRKIRFSKRGTYFPWQKMGRSGLVTLDVGGLIWFFGCARRASVFVG